MPVLDAVKRHTRHRVGAKRRWQPPAGIHYALEWQLVVQSGFIGQLAEIGNGVFRKQYAKRRAERLRIISAGGPATR